MNIEVSGTIDLPFAYREKFVTTNGRRRRSRSGSFKAHVPISPVEVDACEMRLAIHVRWKEPRPNSRTSDHDRVWACDGRLYRPLIIDGKPAGVNDLRASEDYRRYGSQIDPIRHLPPPQRSIGTRWGTRSLEITYPREEIAAREGWTVLETLETDHHQCWADAYSHYERAILSVQEKLWFRCGEPCWYTGASDRLIYEPHRNGYFAAREYALDDPIGADTYQRRVPRESDADVLQLDWRCDRGDFLLEAGRDLLRHAIRIQEQTTGRIRNRAGVEDALATVIAMVDEPLRTENVESLTHTIEDVAERLMADYDVHREGRTGAVRDVFYPALSVRRRIEDLRAGDQLDDEDIEALVGIEFEP